MANERAEKAATPMRSRGRFSARFPARNDGRKIWSPAYPSFRTASSASPFTRL